MELNIGSFLVGIPVGLLIALVSIIIIAGYGAAHYPYDELGG